MVFKLFLALFICTLSSPDAPSYVHDMSMCAYESLELHAEPIFSQDTESIKPAMMNHGCSPFRNKKSASHDICFSETFMPLYGYITGRYDGQRVPSPPGRKKGGAFISQTSVSHFTANCLPSQSLQIVAASIIKS